MIKNTYVLRCLLDFFHAVSVVLFHSILIFTLYVQLYIGIQFPFYFTLQFVGIDLIVASTNSLS